MINAMNIILAADDNYAMPCAITIASILSNNPPEGCNIYVLTLGFEQSNVALFDTLKGTFPKSQIEIVRVDRSKINGAIVSDRFPIAACFRFLVPYLFDFDRALYLDCDIIVNGNIMELQDVEMKNMACGMVEDQAGDDITLHNRLLLNSTYFNSGVLLMNLDVWRKENICNKLISFMNQYPERCLYPDQDAINAILSDKIIPLNYKYNFQERWYEPQCYWMMHWSKWELINEAKQNPLILHYTGPQKPWMPNCSHPLAKLYFHYKKIVTQENISIDDDIIRTRQKQAEKADYIARKKRHRHIRRANLFMILFIIETLAFLSYFLLV